MLKYAIPALALIFVGGCGDKDDSDTAGDSGEEGDDDDDDDTPPEILSPFLDVIDIPVCDGGSWWYYAETTGWTNGESIVNAWDQGAGDGDRWNEEHDLPSIAAGPETDQWDILEQELTPGVAFNQFQPNVNTLFNCTDHGAVDAASMVYTIRVYDVDGNYSDCVIFTNGFSQGVNEVFTGDTDDFNPVTRPSEISPANCEDLG